MNHTIHFPPMQVIIFRIWLDADNRALSHYPVYRKEHLYNTNTDFDYGDFEELAYYILQTNVTYNSFAFQYNDPGTYVFADAQDFNRFVARVLVIFVNYSMTMMTS